MHSKDISRCRACIFSCWAYCYYSTQQNRSQDQSISFELSKKGPLMAFKHVQRCVQGFLRTIGMVFKCYYSVAVQLVFSYLQQFECFLDFFTQLYYEIVSKQMTIRCFVTIIGKSNFNFVHSQLTLTQLQQHALANVSCMRAHNSQK